MALVNGSRLWSGYKRLYSIVTSAVRHSEAYSNQELDVELKKYKPDFISLLQNPAKNAGDRAAVSKANQVGLPVQGQQVSQTFTLEFINEALTLSDLFDLNEIAAVDLLLAGESQQSYFPGLTRGLVAVLLYYDGKASLVNALRTLLQARQGRTWQLAGIAADVVSTITKFTDQIIADGLIGKILELLKTMDPTVQIDKLRLPQYRALGPPKHRHQVTNKINEIHQSLAECLFCCSCQSGLSRDDTLLLIGHLMKLDAPTSTSSDGTLSEVSIILLMALLYAIDIRILDVEEAGEIVEKLPIISDKMYINDIHRELSSRGLWGNVGLKACAQFAWGLTLHGLSQYEIGRGYANICDSHEVLIYEAIENDVFLFLKSGVFANQRFHAEEFFVRKMHYLLTDFIVHLPLLVKELRNAGDETARIAVARQQEGLEPDTSLRRDFEHMLATIAELYSKDTLNLELGLEFWCPTDAIVVPGSTGFAPLYSVQPAERQISLFKFVRLAGDLLLPPLYIPYISMLIGLSNGPQCAHQCYNLLKMNGACGGGSNLSTVSLDHFFASLNQYCVNLREESPTIYGDNPSSHVFRYHPRVITTQEVDGLSAVLRLITKVVQLDEHARVAINENQLWRPAPVLLGLLGCSVPPRLKADILHALAAFCKTADIAVTFWHLLEESQILSTFKTAEKVGGILVELEEVESRNEEYPITLAFIELLNTLVDYPIPVGLGSGYRVPGIHPYADFLREAVLIKFNARAYRKPSEKWKVGASVLEVLHKLLQSHEVSANDFIDHPYEIHSGEDRSVIIKPPGHSLLCLMMSDSSLMLQRILFIIDEATRVLDKYMPFPGKEHLEKAALFCLKMIETTMAKQEVFLAALRQSGEAVIGHRVDKVLLGINARTGRADHLINIAKFVTYNDFLPRHTSSALHVLIGACQSPEVQPKIVSLFTANEELSRELLLGFTECLESDESEDLELVSVYAESEVSLTQIRNLMRLDVVKLMLSTIEHSAPNFAHFMLGFELNKPITKTVLQDPGVLGCPRTCMHSLITIVRRGVELRSGPVCVYRTPQLAALAYRLVYVLCSNKNTSTSTLRYLRSHDFLPIQAQHLPFRSLNTAGDDSTWLTPQSWLLKAVVIELRMTSLNKQRSHVQRLLSLLIDDTPHHTTKSINAVGGPESDYSQFDVEYSLYNTGQSMQQKSCLVEDHARRKLLDILNSIDFNVDLPSPLVVEFCSQPYIEAIIQQYEACDEQGRMLCDVRSLYKRLMHECTVAENLSGPRALIIQEIQQICAYVVERNAYKSAIHARRQAFDAWRQAVEIILTGCPVDLLPPDARQNLLFELLQDLLDKVSKPNALSELTSPVAGVILSLMANLSMCFVTPSAGNGQAVDPANYTMILESSLKQSGGAGLAAGVNYDVSTLHSEINSGARTQFASSFQVVLRGLLEHMIRCSASSQRVRAYLYGSLLYYLQIAQKPKQLQLVTSGDQSVASRVFTSESEYDRMSTENQSTINHYGQNLMDIICQDACDGHDIGRMLAFATLETILSVDYEQTWLNHLSHRGYLQHIVDSLLQDNEQLQALLQPNPEPLRALYIFQSKISLLARVASSPNGARALVNCFVTLRLAECNIFDFRPESERAWEAGFIPSVLSRYRQQILFPVLRLCLALLTSYGPDNQIASSQVLRFIVAHADVFLAILHDRQSNVSLESLEELQLTTAVIGQAAVDAGVEEMLANDSSSLESRSIVNRLQREMLSLLTKYSLTDRRRLWLGQHSHTTKEEADSSTRMQIMAQDVLANVMTLCKALLTKSGSSSKRFRILFEPSLVECLSQKNLGSDVLNNSWTVSSSQPPNLGIVVCVLDAAAHEFMLTLDAHKRLYRKHLNISEVTNDELKDLYVDDGSEKVSSQKRTELVTKFIEQQLVYKTQQLRLLSYIIESSMFLLWRHLEFYLVNCEPSDLKTSLFKLHAKKNLRHLNDTTMPVTPCPETSDVDMSGNAGVSRDQLEQLKRESLCCINESLFKRLQDMEHEYTCSRTRYGFVTGLLRRIRRLLRLHAGSTI